MKPAARSVILSTLVVLSALSSANATGSLAFEGGGYWIDLEIGQATVPAIGVVQFHRPGDARGVTLRPEFLVVEAFDPERRILVVRYRATGGHNQVEPFVLSVHKEQATLQISGKRIASQFNWSM